MKMPKRRSTVRDARTTATARTATRGTEKRDYWCEKRADANNARAGVATLAGWFLLVECDKVEILEYDGHAGNECVP